MPAPLTAATTVAARMSPKVRIVRAIDFEDNYNFFFGVDSLFFLAPRFGTIGDGTIFIIRDGAPKGVINY